MARVSRGKRRHLIRLYKQLKFNRIFGEPSAEAKAAWERYYSTPISEDVVAGGVTPQLVTEIRDVVSDPRTNHPIYLFTEKGPENNVEFI